MKNRVGIVLLFISIMWSCKNEKHIALNAQNVIDEAIATVGGAKLDTSTIRFDFRDKHYIAKRNNGNFELIREYKDSTNQVKEVLSNTGFTKLVNNALVKVPDSMVTKYSASVNSVHYFSVLPYGLNAPAVNKKFLNEVTLKGKHYYKIEVTFNENGGGEDFEDVFIYWIDKNTFNVDYLAYSYAETNGYGFRFREAFNRRTIDGLQFVDYNNYKPKTNTVKLTELDSLFEANALQLLSKIELKNISVD